MKKEELEKVAGGFFDNEVDKEPSAYEKFLLASEIANLRRMRYSDRQILELLIRKYGARSWQVKFARQILHL